MVRGNAYAAHLTAPVLPNLRMLTHFFFFISLKCLLAAALPHAAVGGTDTAGVFQAQRSIQVASGKKLKQIFNRERFG